MGTELQAAYEVMGGGGVFTNVQGSHMAPWHTTGEM